MDSLPTSHWFMPEADGVWYDRTPEPRELDRGASFRARLHEEDVARRKTLQTANIIITASGIVLSAVSFGAAAAGSTAATAILNISSAALAAASVTTNRILEGGPVTAGDALAIGASVAGAIPGVASLRGAAQVKRSIKTAAELNRMLNNINTAARLSGAALSLGAEAATFLEQPRDPVDAGLAAGSILATALGAQVKSTAPWGSIAAIAADGVASTRRLAKGTADPWSSGLSFARLALNAANLGMDYHLDRGERRKQLADQDRSPNDFRKSFEDRWAALQANAAGRRFDVDFTNSISDPAVLATLDHLRSSPSETPNRQAVFRSDGTGRGAAGRPGYGDSQFGVGWQSGGTIPDALRFSLPPQSRDPQVPQDSPIQREFKNQLLPEFREAVRPYLGDRADDREVSLIEVAFELGSLSRRPRDIRRELKADGGLDRAERRAIRSLRKLDRALRRNERAYDRGAITEQEWLDRLLDLQYSGRTFSAKDRSVIILASQEQYQTTLAHELVHAFSLGDAGYIEEGFAEYFSSEFVSSLGGQPSVSTDYEEWALRVERLAASSLRDELEAWFFAADPTERSDAESVLDTVLGTPSDTQMERVIEFRDWFTENYPPKEGYARLGSMRGVVSTWDVLQLLGQTEGTRVTELVDEILGWDDPEVPP